ncbi:MULTISPECIES: glycosyltransferase [Tsukamurella]|uniref:Glycosyltransferase family 4 protein n=2 Tax=Tsukamurella TaxID=2060 RepID=A0A5C5RU18_9ACTN|nr:MULTISPECIES: glycosyltransferase [Tsukamurella]NMD57018.1 glycosyltransferase family 4 protein [Tsukamurella columbiensis]TWS25701.1 glycosyltransferase family 4 protein [Tsukamurella conjunctivitidis]
MLWLSPWMRPLARVYCERLIAAGWEVALVTSDRHPESDGERPYEWVLDPRPKTPGTWPEFAGALRRARSFRPDVVVTELVRDPRWIGLAGGAPRVNLVHDDRPHGADEELPRWERALFGRWNARAASTVAFSRYVAEAVGASAVAPLTSDLDEALVPPLVPAAERRDFLAVGRLTAYKNLDVTLAAWDRHVAGPGWRGDELVLIGDGPDRELGTAVRWRRGPYAYVDVIDPLAHAKGSVVHYRRATQSGVQVLAMQSGVTPIVSPEGALPEFQPPGEHPIGVDDVAALARAFDSLADPEAAARRGRVAREHYERHYAAAVSAAALGAELERVIAARGRSTAR